jgi:hypothetical protein
MNIILDALRKVREYSRASFTQLPIYIVATLFILGILEVNVAYLFLLLGALLVGGAIWIFQALFSLLSGWKHYNTLAVSASNNNSDFILGSLLEKIDYGMTIVTPSYYMGIMSYICIYVFRNALELYNRASVSKADKSKVENRKTHSVIVMIAVLILLLIMLALRLVYFRNKSETILGIILGLATGIGAGFGWYEVLHVCGGDNLSDLFGILTRVGIPANVADSNPVACVVEDTDKTE